MTNHIRNKKPVVDIDVDAYCRMGSQYMCVIHTIVLHFYLDLKLSLDENIENLKSQILFARAQREKYIIYLYGN